MEKIIRFDGQDTTVVLSLQEGVPAISYWGPKLHPGDEGAVSVLLARNPAPGAASIECPVTLCPTQAAGYFGHVGLVIQSENGGWDVNPSGFAVQEKSPTRVVLEGRDGHTGIILTIEMRWCTETDILKIRQSLQNCSPATLAVNWLAAGTVPIPSDMDHLTDFEGRWALEFQAVSRKLCPGAHVRENKRGRTSHDCFPAAIFHQETTNENQGKVLGFHLAWSGNHKLVADALNDGRTAFQAGENLLSGEGHLGVGEVLETPWLYGTFSNEGFGRMSRNFHRYVKLHLTDHDRCRPIRPVHYNTWEAVYFEHGQAKLERLVDKAAKLGVERFVLDDGWFEGRRNDAAGLGDWFVDKSIYPQGLAPLIDRVNGHGMEFGLWVEPEMVNPNSDLYRKHPDWVLQAEACDQIPSRNQLVLDLSKADVRQYLFDRLDALLSEYNIGYLKWDMNRDIQHPGSGGRPSVHRQIRALYQLMADIREKHPLLEVESCSSGGARADFGILGQADRVWTSDSNDALDRLDIQRGASMFLPLGVLGNHVGPRDCHITGRSISIELRAATAVFGHMGLEMDLEELTPEETATLKTAIDLHKRFRTLIHDGDLVRLSGKLHARSFGVVAHNKQEALFSYSQVATRREASPETWVLAGLEPNAVYHLRVVWPLTSERVSLKQLEPLDGHSFSGQALMNIGVQLPHMYPQSALIVHLQAVDG